MSIELPPEVSLHIGIPLETNFVLQNDGIDEMSQLGNGGREREREGELAVGQNNEKRATTVGVQFPRRERLCLVVVQSICRVPPPRPSFTESERPSVRPRPPQTIAVLRRPSSREIYADIFCLNQFEFVAAVDGARGARRKGRGSARGGA